ncbi:MAG: DNA translocase FtsK 4TM domain-containing protein [Armatimonadota bacterium]|nr:DNA translocase FtsK [bacterium]
MRKKRATATKRRTTRRATKVKSNNPFRLFEILGLVLIALCPISLYALTRTDSTGFLGQYIAATLRVTVGGVGAYVVAFLLALAGVIIIVGPLKIIPRNVSIGSGMLFLVVITWASLSAGTDIRPPGSGGGFVGDALALILLKVAARTLGYMFLLLIALIGVYIIIDVPLVHITDKLRNIYLDWREAADERAAAREARVKEKPAKVKNKAEDEETDGRKRTLANIFGGGREKADQPVAESATVVEPPKPAVKINSPLFGAGVPKNGGSKKSAVPPEPVERGDFQLPPTTLLVEPPPPPPRVESELKSNIEIIERTLDEFKVQANVVEIACGPTVARYEIRLAPGIKVNKIVGLADNLAMQLAAIDVRVEAPIPGKAAIGVEVPNKNRGTVVLREIVESKAFQDSQGKLTFALGKDVAGHAKVADLTRMPHMLVGGATNAGKSVGLSTLIASLLFRATPDELKLVLIDPKRVELSLFEGIPHLACPVVKDAKQAAGIFRAVVQEMEKRYVQLSQVGSRNIDSYNTNEKVRPEDRLPYMVVVVDELADLMMQCAAEVEGSITRIAQLARAVGIHLVIATQRPSVDVITGIIKANISSRIAFAVSSHHDSRTILDQKGAERLIGRGDMLFLPIDASKPSRIQGCFVSDKEIDTLCTFLKDQRKPAYYLQPMSGPSGTSSSSDGGDEDNSFSDEFYEPSVRFVVNTGYCSTSMLQRKFKIGYTRAARIVDVMEQQGIVGPIEGSNAKGRQVMLSKADLASLFGAPMGMRSDDVDEDDDDVPPAEIIGEEEDEEN